MGKILENNDVLNAICNLCETVETLARADERDMILSRMRGKLFEEQMEKPDENRVEPLPKIDLQPKPVKKLYSGHIRTAEWLANGFMAVPTLAGHLGVSKGTIYTYISDLKKAGYDIECRNTGNHRGGYAKIFRLAS